MFGLGAADAQDVPLADTVAIRAMAADSLLLDYSLDELMEIRDEYRQETEQLLVEKDNLRQVGILEMEALIASYPESPILYKIIARLAELYADQEVRDFGWRMETYLEESSEFDEGTLAAMPEEPRLDFSRSLDLFQQVIDNFPTCDLVDDAYYHLGFLLDEMGEKQEAAVIFESLERTYPDSPFVPDVQMRIAEYFFNPPVSDIERSIEFYEKVMQHKESPLFDAALYRLGWAYYKLSDYPQAIAFFTVLADDIARVKKLDPMLKHHFPAVRDEAVEYIGISFLDFGGAPEAARYFEKIGGRDYGYHVFKKIGDSYMDVKEEYEIAVQSYEFLLAMYPHTPDAPYIQNKITLAYRRLENDKMAYASRKQLFRKFKKGGEWWQQVSLAECKAAEDLTEKAMRENIDYLLKEAAEEGDSTLYQDAIEDSREYLAAFPVDTSAARIHWNLALVLDTKLAAHENAFEEYVNISNLYLHSRFRKQAAENAIALADEKVRGDSSAATEVVALKPESSQISAFLTNRLQNQAPRDLSDYDKRLVFALDNYIQNFPHEPETEKILAKVGGLYYEKRRFKETIKYFKTLAKHFPESEDLNYARFITMESYFGKGDFRSTELLAKRIREKSPVYGGRANTRLSEAIFLQAQTAADSSEHSLAANEFLRLVAETPDSRIADRALYNAGQQFDKIPDHENSIQTYSRLTQDFPQSEFFLPSLNNLAFEYREIEDFQNAGATYHRLARADSNAASAQVALYNASVSLVQAEAWQDVIQVNAEFSNTYPEADEADDLLFDNAGYFLKLDSLDAANNIYASFTEKYPDSPRVIEAYLRRGEYFRDAGETVQARTQFAAAIQKYDDFQSRGLDPDEFLVAEALFQLAEIKFVEFATIKFELPSARAELSKKEKKRLLLELVDDYSRVAGYGTLRLYAATFKIGQAYEEFARTWATQEIGEQGAERRIVARTQINQTASGLFEKAVTAFADGATALQKFADKNLEVAQQDSADERSEKVAVADSSATVAETWIANCQNKTSENLFAIAELKNASLLELLSAPIPAGMSSIETLVYRSQVLHNAVEPLAKEVATVHLRNLEESKSLGIENGWVDSSRTTLILTSGLVPIETQKLSLAALSLYEQLVPSFETLTEKDDEAAVDIGEQLGTLVEFSTQQAQFAANAANEHLGQTQAVGADSAFIVANESAHMQFVFDFSTRTDSLARYADTQRGRYETLFQQTEQVGYEDATYTFDDLFFALNDGSHDMLRLAFDASQELLEPAGWNQKIGMALIKKDPDEYGKRFGLEFAEEAVPTSRQWLASAEKTDQWMKAESNMQGWTQADSIGDATHLSEGVAGLIWIANEVVSEIQRSETVAETDSVVTGKENSVLAQADTIYFRKSFELDGLPVSGSVELYPNAGFELYLNGEKIAAQPTGDPDSGPMTVDLTHSLRQGNNVLAIAIIGAKANSGLESLLKVKSVANWTALQEGGLIFTDKAGELDKKSDVETLSE